MVRGERWIVEECWEQPFCKERLTSNILHDETTGFLGTLAWWDLMSVTLDDAVVVVKGPARYGRSAAMRLIVQPYDEDDHYFLSFS
jgi:hypothetical protein